MRLKAIAVERAPTIAMQIQRICRRAGRTIRGEYRAQKGKRQREERVLDLDHLERDADVF
jgi:hypothetical protein